MKRFCQHAIYGLIRLAFLGVSLVSPLASIANSTPSQSDCSDQFTALKRAFDRRQPIQPQPVGSLDRLKFDLATVQTIPSQLPPEMRVFKAKIADGSETYFFERIIETKDGPRLEVSELPIDPSTGTYDGSLATVREFAKAVAKTRDGNWAAHVVDVNNLGYMNKNFTETIDPKTGKIRKLSAEEIRLRTDAYLRSLATELQKSVGPNSIVIRTGGDEFLVLQPFENLNEVRQAQEALSRSPQSPSTREIFRDQTRARAQALREQRPRPTPEQLRDFRLNYAPHSQPSVSVGTAVVGQADLFEQAVPVADRLMTDHKALIKNRDNAPPSAKRPGAVQNPEKGPRFNQSVAPLEPVPAETTTQQVVKSTQPLSTGLTRATDALPEAQYVREAELSRFGPTTIVRYRGPKGEERFFAETRRNGATESSRELPKDAVTSIVSSRQRLAQNILKNFIESRITEARSLIWFNVEHLGVINSFDRDKAKGGDLVLRAFADAIRKHSPDHAFTLKRSGSEFVIAIEGLDAKQVLEIQDRIIQDFRQSTVIQNIWSAQFEHLTAQLKAAEASGNIQEAEKLRQARADLAEKRRSLVTGYNTPIEVNDDAASVRARTRGIRYPHENALSLDGL